MTAAPVGSVIEVAAEQTHELRRRVLRAERPNVPIVFPIDADPATVHLAVVDGDDTLGISTWGPAPCPVGPAGAAVQLRGMAVDPAHQGHGLGHLLIEAGLAWAARWGAAVAWANARDSALGFYVREGFVVVGDGFLTADMGLPHHLVVYQLHPEK